ncbi:MAG: hypothetical protein V4635_02930 [Bacteroidota bacterium]
MKTNITILLLIGAALFFGACKKRAGEGGTSSIKGRVWAEDWNAAFTVKNGEYAGADEDVYIIYGDDVSYGDKTKANYNGEFEFKYLREGKYRVYVYSKDKTLTSQSGDTSVISDIEITKKKQTVTLEDLLIYK